MNHINDVKRAIVACWKRSTNFHVFESMMSEVGGVVVLFVQKSE